MLTEARHAAALLFMGISGRAGLRRELGYLWVAYIQRKVRSASHGLRQNRGAWTPSRRAAWRQGLVAENVTTAEINHARASRGERRNA